ncbi:MAG TPA: hypothetical protein VG916_03230 [Gemmatimonadaceae bacterium]|nr:hypothetical protein [Gemmatimonadaceae bacterium]
MTRSRTCALTGALLVGVATSAGAQSYRAAIVENHTVNEVTATVHYAACKADVISNVAPMTMVRDGDSAKTVVGAKEASSRRGLCLITRVDAVITKGDTRTPVQSYTSSGTSYNVFMVMPIDDGYGYRVFSRQEYEKVSGGGPDMSPGFDIVNKTNWDLEVSLDQAGCLYYQKVRPGGRFKRRTGAVWFTIKAHILPDGKETKTDKDCIAPVAAIVGGVFITAISAGTLAKVGAFTAAAGAGGVAGAAAGAKMAVAGKFIAMGMTATNAIKTTTGLVAAGKSVALMGAQQIADALMPNAEGQLKGQFAGYEWPFRCNKMPTYEITGGWGGYHEEKDADGNTRIGFDAGSPLRITKTNDCGNKMMGR